MAITATQRNEVISLLVGMFDAAPSATLMTLFVKEIEAGKSVTQLANDMAATTEFQSLYPTWLTDSEFAASFAETILDGHTSGADLAVAVSILEDILAGGATRGEAAEIAASFLSTVDVADPAFGEAGQAFQNKTDVATYFATNLLNASSDMASLQAVVANIDETQASVDAQKALIDLGVTSTDDFDQMLTIGQDNITGTAGDDMFAAWIFDNQNSAQSGDVINGGLGFDTLMAEIGNSQNFAISLKTTSVEAAYFRAQAASSDSADNDIDDSDVDDGLDQDQQIDAQDMSGTEQFWSTSSRANLTIEDIQRNSHETTIGWQNSDSGDVSYEVYFDNITAPGTTTAGSQLFLELLDLEGMRTTNSASPLLDNPYSGFAFTLDGVQYLVEGDEALSGADATFEQLKDGFNALLAELGLTTVTAALGSSFSAINSSNGVAYTGTTIVLTNSGPEILGAVGWIVDGVLPPDSNIHTSIDDEPPATSTTLTQTDIVFDYVGSGSKSGTFIAGEISQGLNSGSQGIQQFNIVVDRSSNMDEIRSTNNSLEEVYVESMGANGTLKIDNIDDVRVFDASAMQNSVILGAQIGMLDDVAGKSLYDKYVDLTDTQANDTLDNIEFEYTLTGSADVLTMVVSEEAASYDDFELLINSGAGNDVVTLYVNSDDAVVLDAQWAADQEALDNIVIVTGAGDDTVNKFGGGSATIATGSGNDTVYSDNSGTDDERATWLFNAANTDINDILGQGAGTSRFIGEDVTLTVSFSAGNVTGGGVTGGPADAVGFDDNLQLAEVFTNGFESTVTVATTNYLANSATIVQAIKNAINNDATLSKFLLAEDGPNHSLKVTSLVDGVFDADDLAVNINNSVSSAGDLTGWDTAWELYNADSSLTLTQANLDAQVNLLAAQGNGFDSDSVLATDGASIVAATTTQGVLEVLEEQTFDFTGVGVVANGDTITITVNGNAVTYTAAGGDGANTAAMLADFAAGDIASQNWAVAGQILTVTQIATNGAPIAQGTATGTSAEAANVVADTTTQGVTEALEVQTFDFTAWSVVDDGDTVSITVDGTTTTYTAAAGDGATSAAALAVFDAAAPAGYTYVVAGQVLTVSQTAGNGDAIAQGTIGGTGVGAELTGVSSNETPVDNVINVDTGDDVIALSTNALSKEVIVFDDYSNGNVDILNFSESGAGVDFIHLGDYLVDLESASDSVESQRSIALDVNIVTAAAGDALDDGNTVTVITDIDSLAVAGETWSGLTAALLLAAVKDSNTGTDDYAGIDEDTLDITYVGSGDLVGTAMNHIVMVENDLNEGEYKVFHLTSTTSGTDEFDSATLVGTVDFGTSVAFDTTNISIA